MEKNSEDTEAARPPASPEPGQGSKAEEDHEAPGEEEAANTHPAAGPPQAEGDSEGPSQALVDKAKSPGAEQGQQAKREEEDGEKTVPEEEGPTAVLNPHPSLGYQEIQRGKSTYGV